jgi:coenzyme F420 hydrogenase subunit beta
LKYILEYLDAPGRFAFVGKPCDVAALRRYGQYDKRVADKVPYLLSFMCAGVPSHHGSNRIIEKLGARVEDVVTFRYRGDGWPGFTVATLKDGTSRSMSYIESWGDILGRYLQWRCKLCPDGSGEFADIACGDAWHLNLDKTPDFSEHEGQSFLLARSSRGMELAQEAMSFGSIKIINDVKPSDIEAVQFHQSYRRKTMSVRYLASACIGIKYPKYHMKTLLKASRRVGYLPLIRAFLGAVKRGLKVRAGRNCLNFLA